VTTNYERFKAARDLLLDLRDDHDRACAEFRWPRFEQFNWALDWFDEMAKGNRTDALRIVDGDNTVAVTYDELSTRSSQVANWLRANGVRRGDHLLLMLDNRVEVWESVLAGIKLGAVVLPTYTTVTGADLADRIDRGGVDHILTTNVQAFADAPTNLTRFCVGKADGWLSYEDAYRQPTEFIPDGPTQADDLLFMYFTSGTTSKPKIAQHTHASYPVGHLSGMYWNGLQPGDVHLNVSAPGWAKHAWSSFFVPFNAGATLLTVNVPAGSKTDLLDALVAHDVTSFCAPPTVWRMLIQQDLKHWPVHLREAGSVGEPLNPEVIDYVREAWGVTVRDGFGQTETTAQIGNTRSLPLKPGSMGKPLPGYDIVLLDPKTGERADEGEICIDLADRPVGVMPGYLGNPERNAATFAGGYYHTGDIGTRDADGYLTYVGRADDVFKSYDHRISPFELESVLLEHDSVAEAAVVPTPDPVGLVAPKAFVTLAAGVEPDSLAAREILTHVRENLAPHQWIRRLEFGPLPKTTSGKIRRVELRTAEQRRIGRNENEFLFEDVFQTVESAPAAPGMS
jgi:acetyl-CoA synthetase